MTKNHEARQQNKEVLEDGKMLTWTGYISLEMQVEGVL